MFFCSKYCTKALMGVSDVSLIISDQNPCKMFWNSTLNYGSSYTEDNINEGSLALSVLPSFNQVKWCLSGDTSFLIM